MKNAIGMPIIFEDSLEHPQFLSYLQASYIYDVEVDVYSISEVNTYLEKGYINARVWKDGEIVKRQTDLPKFTEIFTNQLKFKQKNPEEFAWLKENTVILDGSGIGKYDFQQALLNSVLKENSIPTFRITSFSELKNMLQAIPNAILKPDGGTNGKGLMHARVSDGKILYKGKESSGELTEAVFADYLQKMQDTRQRAILFEPYIPIRNEEGQAVDFRCLVSKGENGRWVNVLTYARISGAGVAANISDGGSLCFAIDALNQFVPERAEEMLEEINRLALRAAEIVHTCTQGSVSSLGIDVCVDRNSKKIYLIEANSKPGTKLVGPWPLTLVRAQYYKYLIQQSETEKA